jgi:NadR type nicotinamide-nucleotide adenylyltransferase
LKKIAVTGPESTGKSWLSQKLAEHYNTVYVPEIARIYIDSLDRKYKQDDILNIARLQLEEERKMIPHANDLLFCDTELIVIKIWSIHKYNHCDPWILEQITNNPYELYLLCDIDLPWEYDPQREHPDLREYLFEWYKSELDSYGFPYRVVRGVGDDRIVDAIKHLNSYLNL